MSDEWCRAAHRFFVPCNLAPPDPLMIIEGTVTRRTALPTLRIGASSHQEATMSKRYAGKVLVWGLLIIAVAGLVSLGLGGLANGATPPQQEAQFCGPQWNLFP